MARDQAKNTSKAMATCTRVRSVRSSSSIERCSFMLSPGYEFQIPGASDGALSSCC